MVIADERETGTSGARITLNLGHSFAHGLEAADGYEHLLHGEAVAYGLRGACRIGTRVGVTPADRALRAEALLDRLGLGQGPLPYAPEAVLEAMGRDKKTSGGHLAWVLPTADGIIVRSDIPDGVVAAVLDGLLAGAAPSAIGVAGG